MGMILTENGQPLFLRHNSRIVILSVPAKDLHQLSIDARSFASTLRMTV